MARFFNTEGYCKPSLHYMVRLDGRLEKIKRLVDAQKYFVINRGRQYGKTTVLLALRDYLKKDYAVIFMDFQGMSSAQFETEGAFSKAFVEMLLRAVYSEKNPVEGLSGDVLQKLRGLVQDGTVKALGELFPYLNMLCRTAVKPVVLLVDEVDSSSNNQVFPDFLSQLRNDYMSRDEKAVFHSVILAGVYDIKNLKLKIRSQGEPVKYNSPWNIAAKFSVDMSFSEKEIAGMLEVYENDRRTGMDVREAAQAIFDYTSGYPYFVSAICRILDEELPGHSAHRFLGDDARIWSREGISEAVNLMLKENIPIFGSMVKQLDAYKDLRAMLRDVLFKGKQIPFSPDMESINVGLMFGYLREKDNLAAVSNRIFEMRLSNMFLAEAASGSEAYQAGLRDRNQFVKAGRLDMDRVMVKFVQFYSEVFSGRDEKYVESFGREIFLMYLKPIINGVGNSYQESETRSLTRTDIIVDYLGEQFVIELKIWRGQEYNRRGEAQLCEYLDFYRKKKGYLLSFNFNKNKETGVREIQIDDKTIVEAMI